MSEGLRLGGFAFRARTLWWGSAPIADESVVIWGGGLRFANRT